MGNWSEFRSRYSVFSVIKGEGIPRCWVSIEFLQSNEFKITLHAGVLFTLAMPNAHMFTFVGDKSYDAISQAQNMWRIKMGLSLPWNLSFSGNTENNGSLFSTDRRNSISNGPWIPDTISEHSSCLPGNINFWCESTIEPLQAPAACNC